VRDDDFKPGNLALFDIARRQAAESVVAAQRVAIADHENSPHRIPLRQNNSLPGKRWLVLAGAG
jgi:3-methyladenine DNA glycosylase Mpg